MDRRSFKRYDSDILLKFFYGSTMFNGNVVNCSENGVCISTHNDFLPCSYQVSLILLITDGLSTVKGKTVRISKVSEFELNIGVEIFDPPFNYLAYLDGLKEKKNSIRFKPDRNNLFVQTPRLLFQ